MSHFVDFWHHCIRYLLEIISLIFGWCSSRTFTNPCICRQPIGTAPARRGSAGHTAVIFCTTSRCLSRYWSCAMWLQGFWARICAMDIPGDNLFAKGKFIAEALYVHCISPDRGERLKKTGSVSPSTTLKSRSGRESFRWAAKVGGRKKFFTKAACRLAIQLLMEKPDVVVPLVGLPYDMCVESQAKRVMHLAQRARKNSGAAYRFLSYQQSKFMDWQDTLPLEDRCWVNFDCNTLN